MYHIIHQYAKAMQYDIQLALEKEQKSRKREEDYYLEPKIVLKRQRNWNLLSGLLALFTHPQYFGR